MQKLGTLFQAGCLVALSFGTVGCDLTNIAAGSTVNVVRRGAPGLQRMADPDLAEEAIPGGIGTMEALAEIRKDDGVLKSLLARSYASYGFGFMEDRMEAALANDDEVQADHYRERASAAFRRSRELGLQALTIYGPTEAGAEAAIREGIDSWTRYLQGFNSSEEHSEALFWTAYSWARWVSVNVDKPEAVADLPFVHALSIRLMETNEAFMGYAPRSLRGGLMGSTPEQLGGQPREAKALFESAIEATGRRNLIYLVLEARIVARALQDRALYRSLLEEVIAAGDLDPDLRLSNQLAKRRARRYLAEIDMLFEPEGTTDGADANN